MTLKGYLKEIENWLKEYLANSSCKAFVLGISGGVDSTLVAAIAKNAVGKENLFCYALPIDSNPKDVEDALKVKDALDLNMEVVDLTETYKSYIKELNGEDFSRLTKGNLKARMRMSALYAFAQEHNALVLGTDNLDESYVGYFTKYGDGGVDLLPIAHLLKKEVREGVILYGLSSYLANRTPTAGFYEGQTDEIEMGVTYDELDNYLLGKEVSEKAKARIEHLHKISEHKRNPIPKMKEFKR